MKKTLTSRHLDSTRQTTESTIIPSVDHHHHQHDLRMRSRVTNPLRQIDLMLTEDSRIDYTNRSGMTVENNNHAPPPRLTKRNSFNHNSSSNGFSSSLANTRSRLKQIVQPQGRKTPEEETHDIGAKPQALTLVSKRDPKGTTMTSLNVSGRLGISRERCISPAEYPSRLLDHTEFNKMLFKSNEISLPKLILMSRKEREKQLDRQYLQTRSFATRCCYKIKKAWESEVIVDDSANIAVQEEYQREVYLKKLEIEKKLVKKSDDMRARRKLFSKLWSEFKTPGFGANRAVRTDLKQYLDAHRLKFFQTDIKS